MFKTKPNQTKPRLTMPKSKPNPTQHIILYMTLFVLSAMLYIYNDIDDIWMIIMMINLDLTELNNHCLNLYSIGFWVDYLFCLGCNWSIGCYTISIFILSIIILLFYFGFWLWFLFSFLLFSSPLFSCIEFQWSMLEDG